MGDAPVRLEAAANQIASFMEGVVDKVDGFLGDVEGRFVAGHLVPFQKAHDGVIVVPEVPVVGVDGKSGAVSEDAKVAVFALGVSQRVDYSEGRFPKVFPLGHSVVESHAGQKLSYELAVPNDDAAGVSALGPETLVGPDRFDRRERKAGRRSLRKRRPGDQEPAEVKRIVKVVVAASQTELELTYFSKVHLIVGVLGPVALESRRVERKSKIALQAGG